MSSPQFTPDQILQTLREGDGSRLGAAQKLGVSLRVVERAIQVLRERGEEIPPTPYQKDRNVELRKQVEPLHQGAPDGFVTKGVSSYHDGETGAVRGFWLKTDVDKQRQFELAKAAIEELCQSITPQEPIPPPNHFAPKLCNTYVFSDYHMGMLAWHREGGSDWDLNIAEKVLLGCFEQMLANAPPAETGFLLQLGDFLHTDGLVPVTPGHGHVLDADSRYSKIVAVTIRCLRKIVNRMLEKHARVHVVMAEGNHDISSSVWLRSMFRALYDEEPRITVDDSPLPYYAFQFGKTMISAHHGHLTKTVKLDALIPAQFPKMWGDTEFRYVHCGHVHHEYEKEHSGITVVQHPTLASRDAYAARGGWHAKRAARCDTYHIEFGHVGRTIVTPEMVL